MKQTNVLATEPVGKLLMKYSIPAIIGMLVNALYNVVDRMFIGNIPDVGPLAIAGVGISMPILMIVLGFGMLTGIGTTSNISLQLGRGQRNIAEKTLGNGLVLGVLASVFLTISMLIFLNPLLVAFGASTDTIGYAKDYLYILIIGTIFNIVGFGMNATIRADGNPKASAIFMILGCIVNIVLDYIFIFILNLGIQGAALATVISQAITTICVIYYYTLGNSNLKLKWKNLRLEKKLVYSIVAIGLSPFAMQLAASLVQVTANYALKAHGGDLAIGAMTVISSIAMIFLMPIFGINQGSQPIIGFNYGAKQFDRVEKTVKITMVIATAILLVAFLVVQTFPEILIRLFSNDESLMAMGVEGIRIYLFAIPIIGVAIIGANYYQSVGKAKVSMFLSLLRQVIVLIPLMLILPSIFGLTGVWVAGPLSDVIATAVTVIFINQERRKFIEKRKRAA